MAKKDIRQYSEDIKVAEDMRFQAESELFSANKTVKDLNRRIEESKFRARTRKKELETLKRPERIEGGRALAVAEGENYQYAQVMRELESVKQDLSKLKLDMACLLENKSRVEKETEASTSRLRSHSNSIEGLKQEIEEANEEQVLVELARMEAVKEFEAIEAEREAKETKFTSTMEKTRKKIKELMRDIDRTKELEAKLAKTAYDADVLQNELRPVRAMSGSFSSERNETSWESAKGKQRT
ncbi:hypothetical protein IFM89_016022 [Coptis chinensis]|uniref:Uncharacterized protein n=1 Tax=Coptis chinensis TaxID=261450 RepID=A0A835LMC6_9MAGN|nr:hypothetical protein IFM89_016022 [Coptis chinensis]